MTGTLSEETCLVWTGHRSLAERWPLQSVFSEADDDPTQSRRALGFVSPAHAERGARPLRCHEAPARFGASSRPEVAKTAAI